MTYMTTQTTQARLEPRRLTNEQRASVVEKVLALRQLTKETSMLTNKSQTTLLATLSPEDLTDVCVELKRHKDQFGW